MAASTSMSVNTKWVDGTRGIAALLVVSSHITSALAPHLFAPAMSATDPPTIAQLPIIRNLFMGRPSVAIFMILTGYVNALKPTQYTRSGQVDTALSSIAKSAFRRTGRFVIPAMAVTTLSWLICQLGAYRLSNTVAADWIRNTSPAPSPTFAAAIFDLVHNLRTSWTDGSNAYDRIQWTLCFLLRGSMTVYLVLVATAYVQPRFRYIFYSALYLYFWQKGDGLIGVNIYTGMILAELTLDPQLRPYLDSPPMAVSVLSGLAIFLGLFTMSYPEAHPEWAAWSTSLMNLGHSILPKGAEVARFLPSLGAQLLLLGLFFNPGAKRLLSHPWLGRLGKLSFAIYLLHGSLIRSVLSWMLYGLSRRPPDAWLPLTSPWLTFFAIPLFFVILFRVSEVWVRYVDPWCSRLANYIEQLVFREEANLEKTLLMT